MLLADALKKAFALHAEGRTFKAEQAFRKILEASPNNPLALNYLGTLELDRGQFDRAIAYFQAAVAASPGTPDYHYNLGNAFCFASKWREGEHAFGRALQLSPQSPDAWNNLGLALMRQARSAEAVQAFERAVTYRPNFSDAWNSLGCALKDLGQLDAALAALAKAVEHRPDYNDAASNLVYSLNFRPEVDPATLLRESRKWSARFVDPIAAAAPRDYPNNCDADRPLRIGYVSPDLRAHAVGIAMLPIMANHDHAQFEIECFSDVLREDDITARLRSGADHWHAASALSHDQLAALIRERRIDILVDLTMHMARNRLLTFARRAAPVQANFIAYPATSGVTGIDYRITDRFLDPPGQTEQFNSETLLRLPNSFWCMAEREQSPDVGDLPARSAGHVTFGSMNNACKISPPTTALWARVLAAVPDSKLLMHSLAGGMTRDHVVKQLIDHGVAAERIELVGMQPKRDYLATFNRIDICLDPFPYNGGVTTCDSMWMGVPVISMPGQTSVSRGGESILRTLGLDELLAANEPKYIEIARALAGDLDRLATLRASLRDRLRRSPIMDGKSFTRGVEALYRRMWQSWCATR